MENTSTLHLNNTSGNLVLSILLFVSFFSVIAILSFILRIASLGFFKLNLNRKFLRKYVIIYNGLLSQMGRK